MLHLVEKETIVIHAPEGVAFKKVKTEKRNRILISWEPVSTIEELESAYVRVGEYPNVHGYIHASIVTHAKRYEIYCSLEKRPFSPEEHAAKVAAVNSLKRELANG